jgi:mRNA interferase MazF
MRQGEIWDVNLTPTVGAEIKKKRPAIIINDDAVGVLPLRVIIPITEWKDKFYGAVWMVKIEANNENNLKKLSAADCFQIRSVSTKRLLRKVGAVPAITLNEIKIAVKAVIDAD